MSQQWSPGAIRGCWLPAAPGFPSDDRRVPEAVAPADSEECEGCSEASGLAGPGGCEERREALGVAGVGERGGRPEAPGLTRLGECEELLEA